MRYEVTVQTPRLPADDADKRMKIKMPNSEITIWVQQLEMNHWICGFPHYRIKDAFANVRFNKGVTHKERLEACRQELLERWTTVGPFIPADEEALLEDAAEMARAK